MCLRTANKATAATMVSGSAAAEEAGCPVPGQEMRGGNGGSGGRN